MLVTKKAVYSAMEALYPKKTESMSLEAATQLIAFLKAHDSVYRPIAEERIEIMKEFAETDDDNKLIVKNGQARFATAEARDASAEALDKALSTHVTIVNNTLAACLGKVPVTPDEVIRIQDMFTPIPNSDTRTPRILCKGKGEVIPSE